MKNKKVYLLIIRDRDERKEFKTAYESLDLAKVVMLTDILQKISKIGFNGFNDVQFHEDNLSYKTNDCSWEIEEIDHFTTLEG